MNVTRRTCGYLGENYWNVHHTKHWRPFGGFAQTIKWGLFVE